MRKDPEALGQTAVVTAFLLLPKLFLKVFKPLLKTSLPQDEGIV